MFIVEGSKHNNCQWFSCIWCVPRMIDARCSSTLICEVLFLVLFIWEFCHTMFVCILTATCMFCNGVCLWRRSYVTHTQWCVLWDTLRILCWLCGTRSTVFTSTQHCIQVNSWLVVLRSGITECCYHCGICTSFNPKKLLLMKYEKYSNRMLCYSIRSVHCNV